MRYRVEHFTSYQYEEAVSICHTEARLSPRETDRQRVVSTELRVEPTPTVMIEDIDYFGNAVHFCTLEEAHLTFDVRAQSEVDLSPYEPPAPSLSMAWEMVREQVRQDRTSQGLSALELTLASPHVAPSQDLRDYAASSFFSGRPLLEAVLDLTQRIRADFAYQPGVTTVATPLHEILRTRQGVCQDFAHLEIGMLRSLGLPARYVSGYVYNAPAPGAPDLRGADASHAWISVFCPDYGYVDFDPTNGSIPRDEHIALGWGRDFSDASPLRGVILGGGEHVVNVGVDVARV